MQWGRGKQLVRFKVDELLFTAALEIRALLPQAWFGETAIAPRQRGVLSRDGRPVRWLRPGTHRFWTVDPAVRLQLLDLDQPVPELTDELRGLIPANEIVDVTVLQHQRALEYP